MDNKRVKTVAIGSDHAGFHYKEQVASHLMSEGYKVTDTGCMDETSCHYPIFAHRVCEEITTGRCEAGILICGTGIGMSIAANKHRGIRAAVCTDEYTARLTREHNDANVLCMGARVIDPETAEKLADIFLETPFDGGKHSIRLGMIKEFEDCKICD